MESLLRLGDRFRSSEPAYTPDLVDQLNTEEDDYSRNASSNRSRTDLPFLVMQGGFLFVLIFFLGYCMLNGDINRITKGYDSCGNVCGQKNDFSTYGEAGCKAQDMSNSPYLFINGFSSHCVNRCVDGTILIGHRCVSVGSSEREFQSINRDFESFVTGIARDLHTCSGEITSLCFIALGFAFTILLILRYLTGAFVWSVIVGVVLVFVAATGYFWFLTDTLEGFEPAPIISSIITLIIILVILVKRKRIQLVIQLFKEAGKSITAIPLLLLEPLLTFVALGILWSTWIYFMLWIESAGTPTEENGRVIFKQNAVIRFTRWYNLFVMLWMVQFVYGCQSMLIAGAVSIWYFARNKNKLGRPLYRSAHSMIKFHLGTISLGSLIIAPIQILKILVKSIRRTCPFIKCCLYICCLHICIEECLGYLKRFMIYFSRNAYIVTSIHGYPFYESGTRAFKLLVENAIKVFTINSVGDFVLILAKILVVASTVGIGMLMIQNKEHVDNKWTTLVIVGHMAFLIAHCFLAVYEMAIDTIFICFCEDCEINDGLSRPYFMSHELMEFVEKSKSVLGIKVPQEVTILHNVQ